MASSGDRHTLRIVVVDPHDDSRQLYVDYFESVGVHVVAVPAARDALRVSGLEVPDVFVTCLRLPGMDGFELCAALRAMPRTRRVPVVAFSTCRSDHDRAVHDGRFASVLMKPCFPDVLLDSVLALLRPPAAGRWSTPA